MSPLQTIGKTRRRAPDTVALVSQPGIQTAVASFFVRSFDRIRHFFDALIKK
jgi:hypothetical protein